MSKWRYVAAPIIAQVLAETRGQTEAEIRAALLAAYPFGPRSHHPYKIWRDEVRKQRAGAPGSRPTADLLARIEEIRRHNAEVDDDG